MRIRFNSYDEANQALSGMRWKFREGSFDERDYQKHQPLGFANLTRKYLDYLEGKRSQGKMKYHIEYAINYFNNKSLKDINEAELKDLLPSLPNRLSDKTKKNIFTTLHAFWSWAYKRERKRNPYFRIPDFPKITYQSKWRKIVDTSTQWEILEELKRIAPQQKIYIACLWLSTYTNVRPIELIHVKEGDFDLKNGLLEANYNNEKKPKRVFLLDEDVNLVKSFPPALPHVYFFRHDSGIKGVVAGK